MEKWKLYLLSAYTGLTIVKELWEVVSDKPLITGFPSLVSFLSKYWLLGVGIIIFFIIFLPPFWNTIRGHKPKKQELEKIFNRHYRNETVVIDGKHFIDCIFENCTILWNGNNFTFDNVQAGVFNFYTENDTVVSTLNLFKGLGVIDPNFAKNIRRVPKGNK
jgi:hypothetical protein